MEIIYTILIAILIDCCNNLTASFRKHLRLERRWKQNLAIFLFIKLFRLKFKQVFIAIRSLDNQLFCYLLAQFKQISTKFAYNLSVGIVWGYQKGPEVDREDLNQLHAWISY